MVVQLCQYSTCVYLNNTSELYTLKLISNNNELLKNYHIGHYQPYEIRISKNKLIVNF